MNVKFMIDIFFQNFNKNKNIASEIFENILYFVRVFNISNIATSNICKVLPFICLFSSFLFLVFWVVWC